jgi:hypothetical protein
MLFYAFCFSAAQEGQEAVARALIEAGVDLEYATNDGWTW